MGPGGYVVLTLIAAVVGYLLAVERPFWKKPSFPEDVSFIPKTSVILEPVPQEKTESLTPPWQRDFVQKLQTEGYGLLGDYSYSSTEFFWARALLAPGGKSLLMLVNWLEGRAKGPQIISNVEIYSFEEKGGFLLTACAQDGATRLLTGATRPTDEQLSLHLKTVFAESAVRPLMEEHRKRMAEREAKGIAFRELTPEEAMTTLSKVIS